MEVGAQVAQPVVNPVHHLRQRPAELPRRLVHRRRGFGVDQVGHRLGAGQVQLAAQKRPPGELPRLGLPHPGGEQRLQPQRQHGGGAVALQLGGILPGVAMGGPGYGAQAVIDRHPLPVVERPVHQRPVGPLPHGAAPEWGKHPVHSPDGARPGQAQDPDGAGRQRRGNGGNGIVHGGFPSK